MGIIGTILSGITNLVANLAPGIAQVVS